jgi:hypothetical protein
MQLRSHLRGLGGAHHGQHALHTVCCLLVAPESDCFRPAEPLQGRSSRVWPCGAEMELSRAFELPVLCAEQFAESSYSFRLASEAQRTDKTVLVLYLRLKPPYLVSACPLLSPASAS